MKLSDIADEMVRGLNARTTAMIYFGSKGYPVYGDMTFTYDAPALPIAPMSLAIQKLNEISVSLDLKVEP